MLQHLHVLHQYIIEDIDASMDSSEKRKENWEDLRKKEPKYKKPLNLRKIIWKEPMLMPKIRTIQEAYNELKKSDPETAVTPHAIRQMILSGVLPHIKAGKKYFFI